jgi:hypothetical protein
MNYETTINRQINRPQKIRAIYRRFALGYMQIEGSRLDCGKRRVLLLWGKWRGLLWGHKTFLQKVRKDGASPMRQMEKAG